MPWLAAHTHLVAVGPDVVVLDVRANAYFCLPAAAAALRHDGDQVLVDDTELLAAFETEGLVVDQPAKRPDGPPALPSFDLGLAVADAIFLRDVAAMAWAWATMIRHYHLRSFAHLLRHAAHSRPALTSKAATPQLRRSVAVFERLLPWAPFQGLCLYRSFMLLSFLRRQGFDARWVFGVQTWPFQAHCWLQVGEVALDDTADRLASFEPILAV